MSLVSGNIRFMRIFAGVPWTGGVKGGAIMVIIVARISSKTATKTKLTNTTENLISMEKWAQIPFLNPIQKVGVVSINP